MSSPYPCRNFARFVLVWFALALAAAAASPLVRTPQQQLVCTAEGLLQFVDIDDGVPRVTGGLHDCPLCILAGAPPQRAQLSALPAQVTAALVPVVEQVSGALRSAPPLPARGPPARH